MPAWAAGFIAELLKKLAGPAIAWIFGSIGQWLDKGSENSERRKALKRMDKAVERYKNEEPNDQKVSQELIDAARELIRSGYTRRQL